jgi:neutral ceramidase
MGDSLSIKPLAVLALSFVLAALTGPAAAAAGPLKAGAAAVDVTPTEFPFNMPGNFGEHIAQKVHDPFHVRALVLDDGATVVALVVIDTMLAPQELLDEAKALASTRCGIPIDRMLMSATHTHTAPPASAREGRPAEVAYRPKLVEGIAEAVARAHAARRPAAVGAASHPLPEEVFNRRWHLRAGKMDPNPFGLYDVVKTNAPPDVLDRPAGPTDPAVTVLSVRDAEGKPLAVYANYSLHYIGGTPYGEASADYFGEFARLMPSRFGGDAAFVAMLSNGASGDINNSPFGVVRPPREPFEQARLVAAKTADAAWLATRKIEAYRPDAPLGMAQRTLTLKVRMPTPEQVEKAKAVLAVTDPAEKAKLPGLAEVYARRTLAVAEGPASVDVPLQAVRVGDLCVCAIPFETFVEVGLDLKRRSPFAQTIVVGLANGYNGYLPTPEQHKLGGYETWLGTNWVQEDASVLITDQLLQMLGELKE